MSRLKTWRMGNTYGGVNKDVAPEIVPDNCATRMDNWITRTKGVKKAKGWEKFTAQQFTDGAATPAAVPVLRLDQYFKNDGTGFLLASTSKRVYSFQEANQLWIPITPGTSVATTIDQTSTSGTKTLYVASTTGFSVGDTIIITDPGATETEENVVDAITAGVSLTLLNNLTYTHTVPGEEDPVSWTYGSAVVDATSAAGQKVLNVSHTGQFTAGEAILIGRGTAREEYGKIDTIQAGVSVTLLANLSYEHTAAQADKVMRTADLSFSATASMFNSENDNNTFYWTDFVNPVQTWTGTGFSADLVGLRIGDDVEDVGTLTAPVLAKCIRSFEGFLLLGHMVEEGNTIPQKIRWSRYGPANWTNWKNNADGTGQAGWWLFSGPDWIVGLYPLKREMLVYRERSIEGMSYMGPPDIFGFRRAETGMGLLAPHGLIDMGDRHILVGPDDFYSYNGMSLTPIGDSAVTRDFFDIMDPAQRDAVKAFFIEEEAECWFAFPTQDSPNCDLAYVYNTVLNKWSGPRTVDASSFGYYDRTSDATWGSTPGTWAASTARWDSRVFSSNNPINFMGNNQGYVFVLDQVGPGDGTDFEATFETKRIDAGSPETMKRLQKVKVDFDQAGAFTATIYVGSAEHYGDEMVWNTGQTISLEADATPFVYVDVTGRVFQIRVVTTAVTGIRDIELFFMDRGATR